VVGHRSTNEPPRLIGIRNYDASTIIDDQLKNKTLELLYRVLRFLLVKVETGGTYLFSRRYDPHIGKHGLYLYKVDDEDQEQQLRFISQPMLDQLGFKF
jgi:hypothetical protein